MRGAPAASPVAGRVLVAGGGCAVVLLVLFAGTAGAVLLLKHRAGMDEVEEVDSEGGVPPSEIDAIRRELLEVSGELSDPDREAHDLTRADKRLDALGVRLEAERRDPAYLKVKALHESVRLQVSVLSDGAVPKRVPPLPPSSIAPEPDDRWVHRKVSGSELIRSKIYRPSPGLDVKYGPCHFYVTGDPDREAAIGGLHASDGWTFLLIEVGIRGTADLVEFEVSLLDDYRRSFPPLLAAEKELAARSSRTTVWRDVREVSTRHRRTWLTRVFYVPAETTGEPILDIHRQGASKRIWVQF